MISVFSSYKAPSRPIASSKPQAGVRFSGNPVKSNIEEMDDSFKRMGLKRTKTSESVASIMTTASMDAYDRMEVRPGYRDQPERSDVPEMTPEDKDKYRATTANGRFCFNGQPLIRARVYNYVTEYHRITTLFPRNKDHRDDGKGYQHCSVNSKPINIGMGEIREAHGKLLVSNSSGGYYPTSMHLSQIEDIFLNRYDLTGYKEIRFTDITTGTGRAFEYKDGTWQLKKEKNK